MSIANHLSKRLVVSARCPFCKSEERQKLSKKPGIQNRYIRSYFASLPEEQEQALLDKIEVFACARCTCQYFDPWLAPDESTRLYLSLIPQHGHGWRRFYSWVEGVIDREADKRLFSEVERRLQIQIKSYAEFNCPFNGLFFFLRDEFERKPDWRLLAAPFFSNYGKLLKYKLKTRFQSLNRFSSVLRVLSERVCRGLAPRRLGEHESELCELYTRNQVLSLYLVSEFSSLFWSLGCNSNGAHCAATAVGTLGVKCLPLADLGESKIHFDLSSCYLTLDHVADPLSVIEKLATHSKAVLLVTHANDPLTLQHKWGWGAGTAEYLRKIGFFVEEFQDPDLKRDKRDLYFLLSNSSLHSGRVF
jgi:hypothetical protein